MARPTVDDAASNFLGQTRIDYPIGFVLRRRTFQTLYVVTSRIHFARPSARAGAYSSRSAVCTIGWTDRPRSTRQPTCRDLSMRRFGCDPRGSIHCRRTSEYGLHCPFRSLLGSHSAHDPPPNAEIYKASGHNRLLYRKITVSFSLPFGLNAHRICSIEPGRCAAAQSVVHTPRSS